MLPGLIHSQASLYLTLPKCLCTKIYCDVFFVCVCDPTGAHGQDLPHERQTREPPRLIIVLFACVRVFTAEHSEGIASNLHVHTKVQQMV